MFSDSKNKIFILIVALAFAKFHSFAQSATISAHIDPPQIIVGDQSRMFIEVQNNDKLGKLQWAVFPDTFNHLEITERGKIDTTRQGEITTYKQRIIITGFDSGLYKIPAFQFSVIPNSGSPYTLQTDSFQLLVQTVAVDTTQPFKPIKGIIFVKSSWRDYLLYIIGGLVFLALIIFVIIYFIRNKKEKKPVPQGPKETLQEKTLRLLAELDQQQLWQKGQVKEYYIQLTDILRNYIEARFNTQALELTTDELLETAIRHKEMLPHRELLGSILYTADLAKFAKSQPLPAEHMAAMDNVKQFITSTKPVEVTPNQTTEQP